MAQYKGVHTFNQTPSVAQIAAYILFLLQIITFYIITQNRIESNPAVITLHVLYAFSVFFQVLFTLITSCMDPADQVMVSYRNHREEIKSEELADLLYCDICDSYVKLKSRHCRVCGRCVEVFDHHCIWINNCVGVRNYRPFVAMIFFTFSSMTIYIASVIVVWKQAKFNSFLAQMIVLWVVSIVIVVFDFLLLNLGLLHLYLSCRGITTYELIIEEREATRQKQLQRKRSNSSKVHDQDITRNNEELNGDVLNGTEIKIKEKVENENVNVNRVGMGDADEINSNKTEGNIEQKQQGDNILAHMRKETSPVRENKRKGFQGAHKEQQPEQQYLGDSRSSIVSQFFTRNKSLKIIVNSDAIQPRVPDAMTFSHSMGPKVKNWSTVPFNHKEK